MQKIIKYIKKPEKIIIYLMNKNFFFFLPDKLYLKLKFKLIMGKTLTLNTICLVRKRKNFYSLNWL